MFRVFDRAQSVDETFSYSVVSRDCSLWAMSQRDTPQNNNICFFLNFLYLRFRITLMIQVYVYYQLYDTNSAEMLYIFILTCIICIIIFYLVDRHNRGIPISLGLPSCVSIQDIALL